jgi:putative hydrolase of the HAD superfamily
MVKPHDGIVAITFDADGTLWDFAGAMRSALGHALTELQRVRLVEAVSLTVDHLIVTFSEVEARLYGKVPNFEAIRLAAFERTLEQAGAGDKALAARLTELYLEHRFGDIMLYDDVRPILRALRGSFRLGLLTNGNTYPERSGLPDTFDFAVFGQDHGTKKPDPSLFRAALSAAGCAGHQLLHVGDSLPNDVGGARGAGIRSVWLNREGRRNDTPHVPDHEITTLRELLAICGVAEGESEDG